MPGRHRATGLLVRLGSEVKSALDALPAEGMPGHFAPTTFELYTLLAFLYFREAGCEYAVIEVGIGGRLDATNVITPLASVITPLDLEHTDVLGDTLEKIAMEKAGIIKPGVPAFIGLQPPGAKEVFRSVGRERGSAVTFLDEETAELSRHGGRGRHVVHRPACRGEPAEDFRLSMLGEFQAENAALAYLTLRRTMPEIPIECYREGFAGPPPRPDGGAGQRSGHRAGRGAHAACRDAAPRPRSAPSFPARRSSCSARCPGRSRGKWRQSWHRPSRAIIISTPGTFKESDPEEVAEIFRGFNPATMLEKDPARALRRAREESGGTRPILVTGSFYMIAEIGKLL